MKGRWWTGFCLCALCGCNEAALKQPAPDAGTVHGGLPADQASRVLAKVGDRTITLGDFATTLERMDQFDRLRYQGKGRRRDLLQEMIDVQLLADEAERLGLDKDPETQDAIRVILRDALLAKAREGLPTPAQLSDQEVRDYYESHVDKFSEPERRRVAAIIVSERAYAARVLNEALQAKGPAAWGELFFRYSVTAPKTRGPLSPTELAGDLGIVGPIEDPRGSNARIPDPVRRAAFGLKGAGDVYPELIEAQGAHYIVRLNGIAAAHRRSLADSDRAIRVLLIQEKAAERERALEAELRKEFPVRIDEQALATVKVPVAAVAGSSTAQPAPEPSTPAAPTGAEVPRRSSKGR